MVQHCSVFLRIRGCRDETTALSGLVLGRKQKINRKYGCVTKRIVDRVPGVGVVAGLCAGLTSPSWVVVRPAETSSGSAACFVTTVRALFHYF